MAAPPKSSSLPSSSTATQNLGATHETELYPRTRDDAMPSDVGADHVAPLKVRTWFEASTAAQNLVDVHDTLVSAPASIARGWPHAPCA